MTRTIKLQPVYRQNRWEPTPRILPKLVLSGEWFKEAGFNVADVVNVQVEKGVLTIKIAKP